MNPEHSSLRVKKSHSCAHEVKTVTIRGVDKTLYDQFVSLSKMWGHSIGRIFSRLITHYKKDFPAVIGPHRFRKILMGSIENLETIEGEKNLIISKEDLAEAGEKVKFVFKNIEKLTLKDDIDTKTILKHIHRIRNCNVTKPENVSNLIWYSLKRSPIQYVPSEGSIKDITIRNVNKNIYDEFVSACQLNNQKIGEAINEILAQTNPEVEIIQILAHEIIADPLEFLIITSLNELQVSCSDLQELNDSKVLFHRVGYLQFNPDVKKVDFVKSVTGIYNCGKVDFPDSIPRLLQLSRVKTYP